VALSAALQPPSQPPRPEPRNPELRPPKPLNPNPLTSAKPEVEVHVFSTCSHVLAASPPSPVHCPPSPVHCSSGRGNSQ
jgi:hypothetical protein